MRSSVFTVPAGTSASTYTVNSPNITIPNLTGSFVNGTTSGWIIVNNITGGSISGQYIGRTLSYTQLGGGTYTGTITNVRNVSGNQATFDLTPAPVAPTAQFTTVTINGATIPNPVPAGSVAIPVTSTTGLSVGDSITYTGIVLTTYVASIDAVHNVVYLSVGLAAALNNGDTLTKPAQSGTVIYPVDQYVAPVEISIQSLDTGGAQVTVQASVLPLDMIENGPWFNYISDGGQGNLGSLGTINTYSNKVITAIRLVNAGTSTIRVAVAEGGIIS